MIEFESSMEHERLWIKEMRLDSIERLGRYPCWAAVTIVASLSTKGAQINFSNTFSPILRSVTGL